ncbi:DUF4132 domain-containing protein [Streptomyces sp. ID38640]|uniref:DUF4132 domain-containing protein n=1 Tax=Streptomyces sp. ID38640 TaxID=1265399 RepID=UPI00140F2D0F|nr:DUF4132 domain-containing protein [Streptomyces sp. ID38640]QIK10670.1 DUF4132 domain-containing protein [Streptomyces sp. ID38640]
MDELSPHAAQLPAAMAGPQPDADWSSGIWSACAQLTPGELGALLPAAYRTLADESAPDHARRVAREVTWAKVQPSFTAASLTELYAALAASPRATDVRHAAGALLRCTEPWDQEALAEHAALLVRTAGPKADRVADAALAVAVPAGPAVEEELTARLRVLYTDSPLRLAELEVMLATGPRERAMLAEDQRYGPLAGEWPPLPERDAEPSEALHAELARHALRTAADHLAALHAGQIPYAADKAFTPADTDTLRRAARLAKTLPSQGACIALAQAVEAYPTPEAIAALRKARRVVRHAGVSKKLDRLLRRAERQLGRRTEVALRLPDLGYGPDGVRRIPCGSCTAVLTVTDEATLTWEGADGRTVKSLPVSVRREHLEEVALARALLGKTRAQVRTLTRALEGGYAEGTVYRYDRWRAALAGHPVARGTARRLVWEIECAPGAWRAVLPAAGPLDLPEPAPSAAVRLWHPARASPAERRTWRDRISARQVRQPFRQVYREHYLPEETGHSTTMFRGHLVRIEAVLGLAVRQGWNIEDEELTLSVGDMKARFGVAGNLYSGASGWAEAQDVFLQRADGGPQPLAGVDAVRLSEILRSVDLLISTGSFALCTNHAHDRDTRHVLNRLYDQPLGRTARLRRAALRRVLAEHIASGRIELGDRHLHLDGYDIHLATGRVTREGDPVDIDLPTGRRAVPLPFLPYDEALLERVVHTVNHLLEKAPVPRR